MTSSAPWTSGWRKRTWSLLDNEWDVIVVGGGITGAAILHDAAQRGWRALLVEQRDFAWGASSRSSKMVHGGLRYIAQGKLGLTRACARERKALLDEYPELVKPLGFVLPTYTGAAPAPWMYRAGLSLYDVLAGQWVHESLSPQQLSLLIPNLRQADLSGGFRFEEAVTDDARLVFELIREAVVEGASAINYVCAEELLRDGGRVSGLKIRDVESGAVADVRARFVINATGAWADRLREQVGGEPRIRPLRGSHLVFPGWRVPLPQAVSKPHPWDGRPVFALPWEGATIVGTTDHDHEPSLNDEPSISPHESAYLMALVDELFPSLAIRHSDVLSTFAGVRPVIASGKADPSKESRDHVIWEEEPRSVLSPATLWPRLSTPLRVSYRVHPQDLRGGAGDNDVRSPDTSPRPARSPVGPARESLSRSPVPDDCGQSSDGPRAMKPSCISMICCCAGYE